MLRVALIAAPPIGVLVVMSTVAREGTRAVVCAFLAAAWLTAVASLARGRAAVATAACAGVVATPPWGAFFYLSSKPCGLHGSGVLMSDPPDCPLVALDFVSFVVGGASWVALLSATVAGMQYVGNGSGRARSIFSRALLLASALVVVWLLAYVILPEGPPSRE